MRGDNDAQSVAASSPVSLFVLQKRHRRRARIPLLLRETEQKVDHLMLPFLTVLSRKLMKCGNDEAQSPPDSPLFFNILDIS